MPRFLPNGNLTDFQRFVSEVYGLPDSRLFSLPDLLANQQRFTMRALKGIRKADKDKLKENLLISFSWLFAVVNRLHIDLEDHVWSRFPYLCSYCGHCPCVCKKIKPKKRATVSRRASLRPQSLTDLQRMFREIYPPTSRTLADAGVHLAEEMGEVSEAIHNFLGEHKEKQFNDIKSELADFLSCVVGVANSADIDLAAELAKMYCHSCHVCHRAPCTCNFSSVARFKS